MERFGDCLSVHRQLFMSWMTRLHVKFNPTGNVLGCLMLCDSTCRHIDPWRWSWNLLRNVWYKLHTDTADSPIRYHSVHLSCKLQTICSQAYYQLLGVDPYNTCSSVFKGLPWASSSWADGKLWLILIFLLFPYVNSGGKISIKVNMTQVFYRCRISFSLYWAHLTYKRRCSSKFCFRKQTQSSIRRKYWHISWLQSATKRENSWWHFWKGFFELWPCSDSSRVTPHTSFHSCELQLNRIMTQYVSCEVRNSMTNWDTINFLRMNLLHEV
jgi:hypothetical protein